MFLSPNHKSKLVKTENQKGVALIAVLSFLVLLSLITTTIVIISKTSTRKIIIEGDRITSGYIAEGAASRMQWMLMDDIKNHPDSNALKRFDSIMNTSSSGARQFMANGSPFKFPYYDADVTIRIFDMGSGLNISGGQGLNSLKQLQQLYINEAAQYNDFKTFIDCFNDYITSGFGKSIKGLSKADYTNYGLYPLPRDNQMQYRDEILWIPGSEKFFTPDANGRLSIFSVIAPNLYSSQINFFSADKILIMALCNYSDLEAQYIIDGRERWFQSPNLSLYNFIDQKYLDVLRQKFSFQDSGNYTFIIKAAQNNGSFQREMIISLPVKTSMQGEFNQYYEYILY